MPIDPEMEKRINDDIAKIDYDRNTNLTIGQVMDRFSRMTAQVDVDKDPLVETGFDWSKQVYYQALSIYIYEVHAERSAAEGKGPGSQLRKFMPKFDDYWKILHLVTDYAVSQTKDHNLTQSFNKIKNKGNNLETLQDILAMAVVLKDFIDLIAGFKPGGTLVDAEYLEKVTGETEELIKQNGERSNSGTERGKLVDKQSKLIILCLESMDYIRRFAKGAFYQDSNYYKEHYTLNDFHDNRETHIEEDEIHHPSDSPTPPESEE